MSNEEIPEVIPMTQVMTNESGETVLRRVGPVTYALMACVKTLLGQEDTIDISDDERRSVWNFSANSSDERFDYSGVIKVNEDTALISLLMQWDDEEVVSTRALSEINSFLLKTNNLLSSGQVFLSNTGYLCFKNSIDVEGIASEDPDYHGPHLIQPRLIFNMFVFACSVFERVIEDLLQREFNDSEASNLGSSGNSIDLICYEKFLTRNAKAKRISYEMLKTIAVEKGDGPNTDAKAEPSLLGLVQDSTVVYFKEGTNCKYRGANLEGQYFKLDNLKTLEDGQVELMLEFLWYKWKPKTSWGRVVAGSESFLLHPNFNGYAVAELARS
jgi:hypothetical protein